MARRLNDVVRGAHGMYTRLGFRALLALGLAATSFACCTCERGTGRTPAAQPSGTGPASGAAKTRSTPEAPPRTLARLAATDLAYEGAFRLPDIFDWGARGLGHVRGSQGDVLLVLGRDQHPAEFGPVAIPRPVATRNVSQLPVAQVLGSVRSFDGPLLESISTETAFGGGIEYVPRRGSQTTDKLYGSIDNWYGVSDESYPTIWFSEVDGSNPKGVFHVGPMSAPFHGNMAGDYLFAVPSWYADRFLGGRTLVTGKTRGAFHGSQGPSLFAFRAWESDAPSGFLDALPIIWYRIQYPACAGPNVGDKARCDFPGFTMCDKWEGASFVGTPTRQAVLLVGTKGLGNNGYGEPPPGSCGESKGYHCDPYEREVIFYDVQELGAAAQGARPAWSVQPYLVWRPQEFFLQGRSCGQVGGMAYDVVSQRLFVVEKGIGDNNGAVIHVWRVAG